MATSAEGPPKAGEADESTADNTTTTTSDEKLARSIHKTLTQTKVEGGKSAWAMTLETIGMMDGKVKKGDVVCGTFDQAFAALQEMTTEKQEWTFSTTPFEDFHATREDLLRAFVHWSRKGKDDRTNFNVSKAMRRLEAYVDWMGKNCVDLNLKGGDMKSLADAWKMKMTHDKQGCLCWWIDMEALDLKSIKKMPSVDTLRYFVWLSHLVLFDKGSQENGLVFVESIGHKGVMELMTAISFDVGTKLDRLTLGVLPIKIEACYVFNNPTWLRIMMAVISPFIGKKFRKRICIVSNKADPQELLEERLGKECIPTEIAQLQGVVEKDIITETLERL